MPYHYVDVVKLAIEAANARVPMLQQTAIREFGEIISFEVQHGDWTPIEGVPIHVSGKKLESYLDFCVLTRKHWLIPEVVLEATEMWLNPTLTAQGVRWNEIFAMLHDKVATDKAMASEAQKYGCRVGDTTPGVKPGSKPAVPKGNRDNPYAPASHGFEQHRRDRIIKLVSSPAGAKIAPGLARSAVPPCRIDGSPL